MHGSVLRQALLSRRTTFALLTSALLARPTVVRADHDGT